MSNAPLETINGFSNVVEYPKEPICSSVFKARKGFGRYGSQTYISVALQCAFQAAEKKVDGLVIHLLHVGAVKYDGRTFNVHAALQLAEEVTRALRVELAGKLLY